MQAVFDVGDPFWAQEYWISYIIISYNLSSLKIGFFREPQNIKDFHPSPHFIF